MAKFKEFELTSENVPCCDDRNDRYRKCNGSGKTMLLEMIAGARHIPQGHVHYSFIDGNTWDDRYAARKKMIHYIPAHAMPSLVNHGQALYYQQQLWIRRRANSSGKGYPR
jgi:ABC-type multidrug transport system ATPase subunit